MAKKNRTHRDHSWALHTESGYNIERIDDCWGNGCVGYHGFVLTRNGFVYVSTEERSDGYKSTFLRFAYDGRVWDRRYREVFQPSTLTTLARRFVAEIVEAVQD